MTDAMRSSQDIASAHKDAHALLAEIILIDGHNDLPYVIRKATDGDLRAFALEEDRPTRDTDIPKLKSGKVAGQFWAAFVPPNEPQPASYALQQLALISAYTKRYPDVFLPALNAADIIGAKLNNKIASLKTIENGAALENRLDTLIAFYELGVRLITLCHNNTTAWCDSATDKPRHNGLSPFGFEVIAAMNALGMIIDLAHVSEAVMSQVLDCTKVPVVWSHSNAYTQCKHPRNVSDAILERVPKNGGVVMATFVPDFICERSRAWSTPLRDEFGRAVHNADEAATIAAREKQAGPWPRGGLVQFCDQLEYLRNKIGEDHIGIGSDFFGGPQGAGLENASCFPNIFAELLLRGWRGQALAKLAGANFLRVMKAVETKWG